jgi:hypothetical protein
VKTYGVDCHIEPAISRSALCLVRLHAAEAPRAVDGQEALIHVIEHEAHVADEVETVDATQELEPRQPERLDVVRREIVVADRERGRIVVPGEEHLHAGGDRLRVGRGQHEVPAGSKDARELPEGEERILEVLDPLDAKDHVE